MATGLAIEGSDVDITIQGLAIKNRQELLSYIQLLYYSLQIQNFVLQSKLILTARVPVIKLVMIYIMLDCILSFYFSWDFL